MPLSKFNVENKGTHIQDIINRVVCDKHKANLGEACFRVDYLSPMGRRRKRPYGLAICNHRAIAAGFIGKISLESVSLKARNKYKK